MNTKYKYLKYKMKYTILTHLKEENIDIDKIIASDEYKLYDTIPSTNINPIYNDKYEIIPTKYSRIINNDTNLIFTFNCKKALFYKKLPDDMKYSNARMYTFGLVINDKNEENFKDICNKCYKKIIPFLKKYESNHPYIFISVFNIYDININIFENVFSKKIYNIFGIIYTLWMKYIYYKSYYDFNIINNTDIFINSSHTFLEDTRLPKHIFFLNTNLNQVYVYLNNRCDPKYKLNPFKIHLTIKTKHIFWVVEKLIKNIPLFKIKDTDIFLFNAFKVLTRFADFTVLSDLFNIYPSLYINDQIINNIDGYRYSFNDDTYKYENVNQANIVLYVYIEDNTENNRNNIRSAIKILTELFPEYLDIGSNKTPRFNFRINDTICFAFGDGDSKEIVNNDEFKKPTDYNKDVCVNANLDMNIEPEQLCNEINNATLNISNNKLCDYDEKKLCHLNNIYSYNKLLFSDTNKYSKYFLLNENPERKIYSTKDLYEYVNVLI